MKAVTLVQVGVTAAVAVVSLAAAWLSPPATARWLMAPTAAALAIALFSVYVAAVSAASAREEQRHATALHIATAASAGVLLALAAVMAWKGLWGAVEVEMEGLRAAPRVPEDATVEVELEGLWGDAEARTGPARLEAELGDLAEQIELYQRTRGLRDLGSSEPPIMAFLAAG